MMQDQEKNEQKGWKKYLFFLNKDEKKPISTKRALIKIAILLVLFYILIVVERLQK